MAMMMSEVGLMHLIEEDHDDESSTGITDDVGEEEVFHSNHVSENCQRRKTHWRFDEIGSAIDDYEDKGMTQNSY